ncbi:MAG: SAM-dependent chlorinase/fluorinase [Candidatus Woesearchaeota archaeon]
MKPFVSITSDFGIASEGCGVMKATVLKHCPEANVVDLTHEVTPFNIKDGARELETVVSLPIGIHVCVVDPGVGTARRGIIIKAARGDCLVGPDNGVLIPAAKRLGGIKKAVEITNEKYMQLPVSPTFHGRDVFCPAAAHLANGVKLEEFGKKVQEKELAVAPYTKAKVQGGSIIGEVLRINRQSFNVYSNIYADQLNFSYGSEVNVAVGSNIFRCKLLKTFGEAEQGKELLYIDDYGHLAMAINQGFFGQKYNVKEGEKFEIKK